MSGDEHGYEYLDEVPWDSVPWVIGPSGNAVGLNLNGFAVRLTGPSKGQRIPLDAGGPWRPYTPPIEVLAAVEVLTQRGVDGAMFEKLLARLPGETCSWTTGDAR